jgi:hypothetical protein
VSTSSMEVVPRDCEKTDKWWVHFAHSMVTLPGPRICEETGLEE